MKHATYSHKYLIFAGIGGKLKFQKIHCRTNSYYLYIIIKYNINNISMVINQVFGLF